MLTLVFLLQNASPIYGDMGMVGRGSPAGAGAAGTAGLPSSSPNMAALSPGARAGMANLGGPAMAAMAAMASGSGGGPSVPGAPHNMKMHRYLPPTMIQQQVPFLPVAPRPHARAAVPVLSHASGSGRELPAPCL